jgi:hypothetical protein
MRSPGAHARDLLLGLDGKTCHRDRRLVHIQLLDRKTRREWINTAGSFRIVARLIVDHPRKIRN